MRIRNLFFVTTIAVFIMSAGCGSKQESSSPAIPAGLSDDLVLAGAAVEPSRFSLFIEDAGRFGKIVVDGTDNPRFYLTASGLVSRKRMKTRFLHGHRSRR